MKINEICRKEKGENVAVLGCDISSERIDCYGEIIDYAVEFQMDNLTRPIEAKLKEFRKLASSHGTERVCICAEPSGPYGELLFRVAKTLEMDTEWVAGEAVAKTRAIENNSYSKTDPIDCKAIHTLGRRGTIMKHRQFGEPYEALREWNGVYEAADKSVVRAKNEFKDQLKRLFPDFGFKKDFIFKTSGKALMQLYGANPYKMVEKGRAQFFKRMKKKAKWIRRTSLERLFDQATASASSAKNVAIASILETRIRQHYEDFQKYQQRKDDARVAMSTLYETLRSFDSKLPAEIPKVVTTFYLARIVAETGPLSDFKTVRQLYHYAGMDLQVRQSGKYKGKTKISKRGRSALRKVLSFAVLPLVKKKGFYGKMYHNIREKRDMPGAKAMMTIARKFLKMIFGLYRSGKTFDATRVFECASQHKEAA